MVDRWRRSKPPRLEATYRNRQYVSTVKRPSGINDVNPYVMTQPSKAQRAKYPVNVPTTRIVDSKSRKIVKGKGRRDDLGRLGNFGRHLKEHGRKDGSRRARIQCMEDIEECYRASLMGSSRATPRTSAASEDVLLKRRNRVHNNHRLHILGDNEWFNFYDDLKHLDPVKVRMPSKRLEIVYEHKNIYWALDDDLNGSNGEETGDDDIDDCIVCMRPTRPSVVPRKGNMKFGMHCGHVICCGCACKTAIKAWRHFDLHLDMPMLPNYPCGNIRCPQCRTFSRVGPTFFTARIIADANRGALPADMIAPYAPPGPPGQPPNPNAQNNNNPPPPAAQAPVAPPVPVVPPVVAAPPVPVVVPPAPPAIPVQPPPAVAPPQNPAPAIPPVVQVPFVVVPPVGPPVGGPGGLPAPVPVAVPVAAPVINPVPAPPPPPGVVPPALPPVAPPVQGVAVPGAQVVAGNVLPVVQGGPNATGSILLPPVTFYSVAQGPMLPLLAPLPVPTGPPVYDVLTVMPIEIYTKNSVLTLLMEYLAYVLWTFLVLLLAEVAYHNGTVEYLSSWKMLSFFGSVIVFLDSYSVGIFVASLSVALTMFYYHYNRLERTTSVGILHFDQTIDYGHPICYPFNLRRPLKGYAGCKICTHYPVIHDAVMKIRYSTKVHSDLFRCIGGDVSNAVGTRTDADPIILHNTIIGIYQRILVMRELDPQHGETPTAVPTNLRY